MAMTGRGGGSGRGMGGGRSGRGGGGRGGGRGGGGRHTNKPCRNFATPGGCRHGDACRFYHGSTSSSQATVPPDPSIAVNAAGSSSAVMDGASPASVVNDRAAAKTTTTSTSTSTTTSTATATATATKGSSSPRSSPRRSSNRPCRYGATCRHPGCRFDHPPGPSPAQTEEAMPTSAAAARATSSSSSPSSASAPNTTTAGTTAPEQQEQPPQTKAKTKATSSNKRCRFGSRCRKAACRFVHPQDILVAEEEEDDDGDGPTSGGSGSGSKPKRPSSTSSKSSRGSSTKENRLDGNLNDGPSHGYRAIKEAHHHHPPPPMPPSEWHASPSSLNASPHSDLPTHPTGHPTHPPDLPNASAAAASSIGAAMGLDADLGLEILGEALGLNVGGGGGGGGAAAVASPPSSSAPTVSDADRRDVLFRGGGSGPQAKAGTEAQAKAQEVGRHLGHKQEEEEGDDDEEVWQDALEEDCGDDGNDLGLDCLPLPPGAGSYRIPPHPPHPPAALAEAAPDASASAPKAATAAAAAATTSASSSASSSSTDRLLSRQWIQDATTVAGQLRAQSASATSSNAASTSSATSSDPEVLHSLLQLCRSNQTAVVSALERAMTGMGETDGETTEQLLEMEGQVTELLGLNEMLLGSIEVGEETVLRAAVGGHGEEGAGEGADDAEEVAEKTEEVVKAKEHPEAVAAKDDEEAGGRRKDDGASSHRRKGADKDAMACAPRPDAVAVEAGEVRSESADGAATAAAGAAPPLKKGKKKRIRKKNRGSATATTAAAAADGGGDASGTKSGGKDAGAAARKAEEKRAAEAARRKAEAAAAAAAAEAAEAAKKEEQERELNARMAEETEKSRDEERDRLAKMREEVRRQQAAARERKKTKKSRKHVRWVAEQAKMGEVRAKMWSDEIGREAEYVGLLVTMAVAEFVRQNKTAVMGLTHARVESDEGAMTVLTDKCREAYQELYRGQIKSRVVVAGLDNRDLNGKRGAILHWDGDRGEYCVGLDTKRGRNVDVHYLKPENLDPAGASAGAGAAGKKKKGQDAAAVPTFAIRVPDLLCYGGAVLSMDFLVSTSDVDGLRRSVSVVGEAFALQQFAERRDADEERRRAEEEEERQREEEDRKRRAERKARENEAWERRKERMEREKAEYAEWARQQRQQRRQGGGGMRYAHHDFDDYYDDDDYDDDDDDDDDYEFFRGAGSGGSCRCPRCQFQQQFGANSFFFDGGGFFFSFGGRGGFPFGIDSDDEDDDGDDFFGGFDEAWSRREEERREAENREQAEILGVPVDADSRTIKTTYRKMALQYHPDKWKDDSSHGMSKDDAEDHFKKIQNAYDHLMSNFDD